jgi:hypothetical protein
MSKKTIIACDPGVNGGFAVHTADGILLFPMPESLPDMAQLLSGFKVADSHIWIEKVPKFVSKLTPAAALSKDWPTHRATRFTESNPRYGRTLSDSVAGSPAPPDPNGSVSSRRRPRSCTRTSM